MNTSQTDNRLELLLFYLNGPQRFAINVLKIKEVIGCPPLTSLPESHPTVCGVANLRGQSLSVIDISRAIGMPSFYNPEKRQEQSVIIASFNRSVHGLLVNSIDRIVVKDWQDILPPPKNLSRSAYITGIASVDNEIVQILDVESILAQVVPANNIISLDEVAIPDEYNGKVLVVDDSSMARSQTAQTLDAINVRYEMAENGVEALKKLKELNLSERPDNEKIIMVLSDIEMPEMDGYSLTRAIRAEPELAEIYVLLHTSLDGAINKEHAEKSGANAILSKFVAEDLADAVASGLSYCNYQSF